MVPHSLRSAFLVAASAVSLSGCLVGPTYERPTAPVSATFKEADGWKPSTPMDHIDRGAWWSVFNDPTLDALERRVESANQTLAAAAAAYSQAQAVSAETRATLFPTLSVNGSATRSGSGGGGSIITAGPGGTSVASGGGGRSSNRFNASAGASWAPDLWGRIRRTIEANKANEQGSAADLASARLSLQADLAGNYFAIQALDEQKTLLDQTVAAYQRSVDLTQNRYDAGVIARADVISAQVQLQSAQAQAVDIGVQRAQLEHAIAVLVGTPPAGLTIAAGTLPRVVPTPPAIVPATLLERRPDIAGAERDMAAANAQIGVATAAYYPTLNLSGSYGFTSSALGGLFSASNSVWSIGPSLAETVLDFGARKARVQQTRAVYDQRVAQYRQTVLAAFQSVEDQLAALRVYQEEQVLREANAASANRAEELALNRYRAGQVDFNTVITAQTQALTARQALLTLIRQRLTASVNLIEALGGGWTTADLPRG